MLNATLPVISKRTKLHNSIDEAFYSHMQNCYGLLYITIRDLPFNENAAIHLADLRRHIVVWTEHHSAGLYYPENKDVLENQDFSEIDDRYGIKTIKGIIQEFYFKFKMIKCGYTVHSEFEEEGQVKKCIDVYLSHENWKGMVSCQVKAITTTDHYGHFTKTTQWVKDWFNGDYTRLVLVDDTHILWGDSLRMREVLLQDGKLTMPNDELSLFKIHSKLLARFKSFDTVQYDLIEKI